MWDARRAHEKERGPLSNRREAVRSIEEYPWKMVREMVRVSARLKGGLWDAVAIGALSVPAIPVTRTQQASGGRWERLGSPS